MKKLVSLVIVMALVLSLAVGAAAQDTTPTKNNSITINNAKVGETYNLYKLFDLSVDNEADPRSYTYTVTTEWADFFKAAEGEATAGAGNKYITINQAGAVTEIKDANGTVTTDAKDLAKAAENWDGKPTNPVTVTVTENATTAVFSNLENGYYLITSSLGTAAMTETTPSNKAVTINEKNSVDSIEKKVQEDSTNNYVDANTAQLGDTVNFKSTVTLNKYTTNVKVHDTMDSGLTYQNDVKIYTDENCSSELAAVNYSVLTTADTGDTFTIKFEETYLASLTGETKLYLTYSAKLNTSAIKSETTGEGENATTTYSTVDQKNKTTITYGKNQTSTESNTITTTHKFEVFKHAKVGENENKTLLAGATFELKKNGTAVNLVKLDDTNYRVATTGETNTTTTFTTVASGNIVIWGVDTDSDYTLNETVAPVGYNKLTAEAKIGTTDASGNFTGVSDKDDLVVYVENATGAELPSTGGVGTTIFYVLGGLMFVGALVLLVTNKRMKAE